MYCQNCGNQVSDTAKFCKNCGATIEKQLSAPTTVAPPPKQIVEDLWRPKKKKNIWLFVLLAFFLLYIGFAGVIFMGAYIQDSKKIEIRIGTRLECKNCGIILEDNTKLTTIRRRDIHKYTFKVEKTFCEKCANELVKILVGKQYVCEVCGKAVKTDFKYIMVKRKDAKNSGVQIVKTKPCSKLCLLKKQHPIWSDRVCEAVLERNVFIGMTAEQATAAWGRPDDINRTSYQWGIHEQWVYEGANFDNSYLYFENGILTTVQN